MTESVAEARCGPHTIVEQRPGSLRELPDGALEIFAEAPYLIRLADASRPRLGAVLEVPRGGSEGTLRFGNFVGSSELGGRRLVVRSDRLDAGQVEEMLDEVAAELASLPFSHATPVDASYERSLVAGPEIVYQSYAVLRDAMRGNGPHDLPAAIERILGQPHEGLVRERRATPVAMVDHLEPSTLFELLARPDRLHPVRAGTAVAGSAAAKTMRGRLPEILDTRPATPTTDTLENRFVVRALGLALDIVRRFRRAARAAGGPAAAANEGEASEFEQEVVRWRRHPALVDLPAADRVPQESTVLRGRPGYRELNRFYVDLLHRTRTAQAADLGRLLELRDAATLYEYWCFFEVVRAVAEATATRPAFGSFSAGPYATRIPHGYVASLGEARVWFNRTFRAASPEEQPRRGTASYSERLRPDIAVEPPGGGLHLFDAKLKRKLTGPWLDGDDANEDDAEGATTFKRADLHKMHAYRDALGAQSVWVLFPAAGGEREYFRDPWSLSTDGPSGVGAIPLAPGGSDLPLADVVSAIVEPGSPQI